MRSFSGIELASIRKSVVFPVPVPPLTSNVLTIPSIEDSAAILGVVYARMPILLQFVAENTSGGDSVLPAANC
jgi:hypothetical protein